MWLGLGLFLLLLSLPTVVGTAVTLLGKETPLITISIAGAAFTVFAVVLSLGESTTNDLGVAASVIGAFVTTLVSTAIAATVVAVEVGLRGRND